MDPTVVRLRSVTKSLGARPVVADLTLDLARGEVFALIGPNGAGKTTTVRMLVGIIRPDGGVIEVTLDGRTSDRLPPALTGYLPEDRGLYREVAVLRTLVYFGMLRGLERREARRRAHAWLEKMGLADRRDERLDALSKGNQQRVQLIAAVIHRPALAILDEPFSGLDPLSQEFFLDLVRELRDAGTTILLSAHQMDLVERAADRVLLMNRGREILSGSVAEMHARLDSRPRLALTLDADADAGPLRNDPDVEEARDEGGTVRLTLRRGASSAAFLARAVARSAVRGIATESPRLHDLFVRAVREDDARREESAS